MRKFRCEYLLKFSGLVRNARDHNTFRLVFLINTKNAVESLEVLHGGGLFEFVHLPMVSKDALVDCRGEDFVQIFEECDNNIGNAHAYVTEKPSMSAKDFSNMRKLQLLRDHCLLQPITSAEYNRFLDNRVPK